MSKEVLDILNRIGLERNIPIETLYDALEAALISASKKMLPPDVDVVEAELDRETGEFRIYANMEVVEVVEDENMEISLEEARQYVDDVQPGEELVIDVTPDDFGRIAAQSAKQVITQRIREAEREVIYDKYKNRAGDLVVGTVQRYEKGNVIVDLGNAEAVLSPKDHPPGERYRYGDRVKAIITEIRKSSKDAQIVLSRNTPALVVKLFEQEVAEIRDGVVSIRLVAREAGKRSKIAVLSSDNDVDPVGACVGMKGSRVQMVVQELRGERIDIIEYSDDKKRFVANSLKPANIESVELDDKNNRALLVVRDDELALAIGKNGLNAKLASELTGVEIDIVSESQIEEREAEAKRCLLAIPSINDNLLDALLTRDIFNFEDILKAGVEGLTRVDGIDKKMAEVILAETKKRIEEKENAPQKKEAVSSKEEKTGEAEPKREAIAETKESEADQPRQEASDAILEEKDKASPAVELAENSAPQEDEIINQDNQ
ncbi:MAG: transcription termination factor NusA [Candidatus Omnitrophota bacterium]